MPSCRLEICEKDKGNEKWRLIWWIHEGGSAYLRVILFQKVNNADVILEGGNVGLRECIHRRHVDL